MTVPLQRVVLLFLQDPSRHYYGLEIAREAELQRGTLYPLLGRLEDAGWISGERESIDPTVEGRPPRTYYRLTDEGLRQATQIRDEVLARIPPHLRVAGP